MCYVGFRQFPKKEPEREGSRVTRLGEFSPIGRLLSLISYWKMTEVAQIFALVFLHGERAVFIVTKNCVGCPGGVA
jgi:hypothetical protein